MSVRGGAQRCERATPTQMPLSGEGNGGVHSRTRDPPIEDSYVVRHRFSFATLFDGIGGLITGSIPNQIVESITPARRASPLADLTETITNPSEPPATTLALLGGTDHIHI